MAELAVHAVAKSATRRHLVLGGERGLVFTSLLTSALAIFICLYQELLWLVIPTVVLQLGALGLFRAMAKRDPFLAHVYWRRTMVYRQKYYPSVPIPVLYK